jgi:hypothetical protein
MRPSTPSAISLEKKAKRTDYLSRTLNTLFNPFEYENILSPPNASPGSKALHHAGGLLLGYGGLALVARKLIQAKNEASRKKDLGKLRDFAAAKYPTISLDPSLADDESAMEAPGVEPVADLPELDEVQKSAGSFLWGVTDPVTNVTTKTMRGEQDTAHLALAAAAAVIGGTAGWKFADYLSDQDRNKELQGRIETKANEIDKLLYEEMQKRQKTAAQRLTPADVGGNRTAFPSGGKSDQPGLLSTAAWPPYLMKGVGTLWWLWAVAAFALTYRAAKTYGDAKDPARKRMKELQAIAQERAKMKNAPVLMDIPSLPEEPAPPTRTVAPAPVQAKLPAAPKSSIDEDMGRKPEVDANDPYAHLLTQ